MSDTIEYPLPYGYCSKCKKNEAQQQHTCPYASDVHDDNETLCNCCEECENECCMDI